MEGRTNTTSCRATRLLAILVMIIAGGGSMLARQNNLRFDRITSEQGLSDNYVLCSMQDRYGFMWFGTRDGLNRFDGYRFTIYRHDPADTSSLSDGSVNTIFEDRAGNLWIGTHGRGLNLFDRVHERFIHVPQPLYDRRVGDPGNVTAICEDPLGNLWVVTASTLTRLDAGREHYTVYHHNPADPHSLNSNNVTTVTCDRHGTIWVGTKDHGINRYLPERDGFINDGDDPHYSHDRLGSITTLSPDPNGSVWVRGSSATGAKLTVIDGNGGNVEDYRRSHPELAQLQPLAPSCLYWDRDGLLWIGTWSGGLSLLDRSDLSSFVNSPCDPHSLSSNSVFCICADGSGNLWIGTDHGICKLDRRSWSFEHFLYDPLNSRGLSTSRVRAICEEPNGRLWIGTAGGGLDRLDPGASAFTHYTSVTDDARTLSENTVNTIYRDGDGVIWVGTNHGLNRFNAATSTFTRFLNSQGDHRTIGIAGVWSIMEDRDRNLWVGTLGGGLNRLDRRTGTFSHFYHDPADPSSLVDNNILCLLEDERGIWIGTDVGLDRFDRATGRFTHMLDRDPGGKNHLDRVWYLHEDAAGALWIATSGGGLCMYQPRTGAFTRYTERDGLAHNIVCGILEDGRGNLWISTNKGLSKFDPRTGKFKNYGMSDGPYLLEFHFKTCFRNRSDALFFGGTDGVIRFHPDSITDSRYAPNVVLTSFRIFDQQVRLDSSIGLKKEVHLDHGSNFFTIDFASLDLTNSLRNQYKYRLEGFDAGWRETDGSRPYASYTNIPPGRYTLHVMGSNCDGIWNGHAATIDIIVEPAYWQTWWFSTSAALLGCSLLGFGMVARTRSVRRKGFLERKLVESQVTALRAQMNPHFIFNSLNSILHFVVGHDAESAHIYLSKFSKLIRSTLENSESESITLAEEVDALRFYLDLEMLRFDNRFSYEIIIDPMLDLRDVTIPPLLIQPYAENAIRHGLAWRHDGGLLNIDICRSGDRVICSVTDNGIGRKKSRELNGLRSPDHRSRGMSVTRDRLYVLNALKGGEFGIEVTDLTDSTGHAAGTRVDIHIPLRAEIGAGGNRASGVRAVLRGLFARAVS
ncbi:MAG: signal transduction histidine kinase [Chlorobi bacterium]|nr:signal transduction histidine kinase [Chlorobiota bacterium]